MSWNVQSDIPLNARNHACAVCHVDRPRPIPGAPQHHERIIETGAFIDGEGEVVICESCIVDVAVQLGMKRASDFGQLQAELEAAKIGLIDHRNHIEQLTDERDALRTALRVRDSDDGPEWPLR